ncbi:MAG: carbamate kinase [Deltaproteobacteria bacterium]|nr:carbamate kinase [Deltaproteobacteria bacterium]MBT6492648.1 carbamate kinase [Deltaproteobacteria bacterium]
MSLVVIAIGGNSLIRSDETGTIQEQFKNARATMKQLVELVQAGFEIVLTHGNGPQVGNLLLRVEATAPDIVRLPLGICDADTQGGIGYMLQQVFQNQLALRGIHKTVVSLVTQVEVNPDDPELQNPSKPIGPFYSEEESKERIADRGWIMKEDAGRGYRRLVPSPKPLKIIELKAIKAILKEGMIPIAVGGGGIPVVRKGDILDGLDGVIDKDRASSLLASTLGADVLAISTGVSHVQIGFGTENARKLEKIKVSQLRELYEAGEFPPGSMGPKVEAALKFIDSGGAKVIITDPENLKDALEDRGGTRIFPD